MGDTAEIAFNIWDITKSLSTYIKGYNKWIHLKEKKTHGFNSLLW